MERKSNEVTVTGLCHFGIWMLNVASAKALLVFGDAEHAKKSIAQLTGTAQARAKTLSVQVAKRNELNASEESERELWVSVLSANVEPSSTVKAYVNIARWMRNDF